MASPLLFLRGATATARTRTTLTPFLRRRPLSSSAFAGSDNISSSVPPPPPHPPSPSRSPSPSSSSSSSPSSRLERALYRRLLSWCRSRESGCSEASFVAVPFDPLPPLTIHPPRVDAEALRELDAARRRNSNHDTHASSYPGLTIRNAGPEHRHGDGRVPFVTIPPPSTVADVRSAIRLLFRLNHYSFYSDDEEEKEEEKHARKERATLAFETLRSLNELTAFLDRRAEWRLTHAEARRKKRLDDDDNNDNDNDNDNDSIRYHVGQVVRHRVERWRGVVCGWRTDSTDDDDDGNDGESESAMVQKTSLTTKDYLLSSDSESYADSAVKYAVLVDSGDAHLRTMHGYSAATATLGGGGGGSTLSRTVQQRHLAPVDEPGLLRIRNDLLPSRFVKFRDNHFVPGDILSYEYPSDRYSLSPLNLTPTSSKEEGAETEAVVPEEGSTSPTDSTPSLAKSCAAVNECVRSFAREGLTQILESHFRITEGTGGGGIVVQKPALTDDIAYVADALGKTDEELRSDLNPTPGSSSSTALSPSDLLSLAVFRIRLLLHLHSKLQGRLHARRGRKSDLDKREIKYSLGQIVKHKTYGFRGVVVAWDPEPTTDVSNWDGLKDLKGNPNQMPFYHVVPDPIDCVRAFGGTRSFRYVCQENLVLCNEEEKATLNVNLGGGDDGEGETYGGSAGTDVGDWTWDGSLGKYVPSDEMKFMYAEHMGDLEDVTVSCLTGLNDSINNLLLSIRGERRSGEEGSNGVSSFSMDDLFVLLRSAESLDDASSVQDFLKEIWKASADCDLRYDLHVGISDLLNGNGERSLKTFSDIVAADPTYGEAWNKKATVHYMLGERDESLDATRKALEIDPRNFQSLSGLGLIRADMNMTEAAAEAFRRGVDLDPWSPVAPRLSSCLDKIADAKVARESGGASGDDEGEEGSSEGTAPYHGLE